MKALGQFEVWLVTGSQQLYGDAVLGRVAEHSREVAESLDAADVVPVRVVHKARGHERRVDPPAVPRGERRRAAASA